jgi:beta-glucosidase
VTRPVKMLKGFKRIHLAPGESRRLRFDLDLRHLAFYDRHMNYVVEPGTIELMIGSSSEDIRLSASVEIVGAVTPVEQVFFTKVQVD